MLKDSAVIRLYQNTGNIESVLLQALTTYICTGGGGGSSSSSSS